MGAGPLVVTYPLTGRSRAIVEEELGETAEAIYLVDLAPAARAHALERAGAVPGEFNQSSANRMLRGGVCGILGFGNVGVATARLMRTFGMKIHAINRRGASHEPTDWIATTDLLDEMLRVDDVLVISAALTTATEGLIGARELGLMKENTILINVARGETIDEGALYAHLVSHPHFFAGIDAWWAEPVRHGHFAMGYPFLDLPNVIGSPHNSAGGGAWRDEYLRRAVQNCRCAILGETPRNLIGPDEQTL